MAAKSRPIDEMLHSYEKSLENLRLSVLIFGPGKEHREAFQQQCYRKRLQIKALLEGEKCVATLPEEAFAAAKEGGREPQSIFCFERHLIENHCDVAFFIHVPDCPGVTHELTFFSSRSECTRKMRCFVSEEHRAHWTLSDVVGIIRGGGGHVEQFSKADVPKCHLATTIVRRVRELRIALQLYPYKKHKGAR